MDAAERILKEIETPEGQKKLSKWVEEYIEGEKIKNENIKVMMSNTNYLDWLCKFTQDRLNEKGFKIGTLIGQGTVFFCKKIAVKNEQEFIDFNDIINGKKREKVDQIRTSLDSLSNMVLTAYESGVPIEAITYTLENTIKEIIFPKENKSKSLIKK